MTEGPYKLPEGWRWVRLGEIAWRESVTLKPSDYPDLVFRYLGMEHVAPGQWDEPMPVEIPGREIKSQVIVYRPGLILYGKLRPYLNKVVVPSTEGVASTEFVPKMKKWLNHTIWLLIFVHQHSLLMLLRTQQGVANPVCGLMLYGMLSSPSHPLKSNDRLWRGLKN
jgi:type I restriction enzyme S subunit